jgi:hypothetical protein
LRFIVTLALSFAFSLFIILVLLSLISPIFFIDAYLFFVALGDVFAALALVASTPPT